MAWARETPFSLLLGKLVQDTTALRNLLRAVIGLFCSPLSKSLLVPVWQERAAAEAEAAALKRREEAARLRFQRQMSVLLPGAMQAHPLRPLVSLDGKDLRLQVRKAGTRWAAIVW